MKLRAIVFEDEPLIREFMFQLLQRRGYEVFAYSEPGLCPLNNTHGCSCPPGTRCSDVIISDIHMNGSHGLDYIERLRQLNCKQPRVAVISGTWTGAEMERAAKLGCKCFPKPVFGPELAEWLQAVEQSIRTNRKLFNWHHLRPC